MKTTDVPYGATPWRKQLPPAMFFTMKIALYVYMADTTKFRPAVWNLSVFPTNNKKNTLCTKRCMRFFLINNNKQ